MNRSQQAVCGASTPTPPPPFLIEVEAHIFQRLSDLAAKEQISMNRFVSELLKCMLLQHRREVTQIVETIKKRAFR